MLFGNECKSKCGPILAEISSQFEGWNFRCGTMCGLIHQSGEDAPIRIALSFLFQVRQAALHFRLDL